MCSLGVWALLRFHLTVAFNYLWLLCPFLTVILHDTAELFQYTAYLVSLFHNFLHIGFPHFNFYHHTNTIFELLSHHIPPSTISPNTVPEEWREKEKNTLLLQVTSPNLLHHGSGTLTWLQLILNKKHHSWSHLPLFGILFNITPTDWSYEQRTVGTILTFSISTILFSSHYSTKHSTIFSLM